MLLAPVKVRLEVFWLFLVSCSICECQEPLLSSMTGAKKQVTLHHLQIGANWRQQISLYMTMNNVFL
jgi:hypothetical protein